MELLYVTGNKKKVSAAKNILESHGINITKIDIELDEIQGNKLDVSIKKAKDAYQKLLMPLIINDSSFEINALDGFPGVYASYVEKTLGDKGILKLLNGTTDRTASYVDILVYIDEYDYQAFFSITNGTIAEQSFEGNFYPYDKIFIRKGDKYPIAYYGYEEIDKLYETDTYSKLLSFFQKRKVSRGITFIDDKVLLLHRIRKEDDKYLEYYAIPGGGVEEYETIEEACIRELKEETSLDITLNKSLGFEEYETGVCYYFLANYHGGEPILGGEEKEMNNPDNFYEIKLIDIEKIDGLPMYGSGINKIKDAYKIYKDKK